MPAFRASLSFRFPDIEDLSRDIMSPKKRSQQQTSHQRAPLQPTPLLQSPSQGAQHEPETPISAPPSSGDGGGSTQTIMTQFTMPPEVAAANDILLTMKAALGSLGVRSFPSGSIQQ
jgi:hypothetical protein